MFYHHIFFSFELMLYILEILQKEYIFPTSNTHCAKHKEKGHSRECTDTLLGSRNKFTFCSQLTLCPFVFFHRPRPQESSKEEMPRGLESQQMLALIMEQMRTDDRDIKSENNTKNINTVRYLPHP